MSASAPDLRAAFKRAGFNSRMVSVRHDHYSMGSSVYVTIRHASVPHALAKRIAEGAEHVDRDQWGDILSGGNTFVHVDHDSATTLVLSRRHHDALQAAIDALDPYPTNSLQPITGTECHVGRQDPFTLRLWTDGPGLNFGTDERSVAMAAYRLALLDADQQNAGEVRS